MDPWSLDYCTLRQTKKKGPRASHGSDRSSGSGKIISGEKLFLTSLFLCVLSAMRVFVLRREKGWKLLIKSGSTGDMGRVVQLEYGCSTSSRWFLAWDGWFLTQAG